MMTPDQITASIEALQPAPKHESLHQVAVRTAMWLLSTIADAHPAIARTHALYSRVVNDGGLCLPPTDDEWLENEMSLDLARALAIDLARAVAIDLAQARALGLARALAIDLAQARALDLAIDLARALAIDLFARVRVRALELALVRLLGDRLQPVPNLDQVIWVRATSSGCSVKQSQWHSCETEHCRAGWAITVHPLGPELEKAFGPALAGAVIYQVSTGRVPDFYNYDSKAVLADIRACAARASK